MRKVSLFSALSYVLGPFPSRTNTPSANVALRYLFTFFEEQKIGVVSQRSWTHHSVTHVLKFYNLLSHIFWSYKCCGMFPICFENHISPPLTAADKQAKMWLDNGCDKIESFSFKVLTSRLMENF